MLMMVTCSEDGARFQFFGSADEMTAQFAADEREPPSVWLTPEQAEEDPYYWPKGSAFLAEVKPMRLA